MIIVKIVRDPCERARLSPRKTRGTPSFDGVLNFTTARRARGQNWHKIRLIGPLFERNAFPFREMRSGICVIESVEK